MTILIPMWGIRQGFDVIMTDGSAMYRWDDKGNVGHI